MGTSQVVIHRADLGFRRFEEVLDLATELNRDGDTDHSDGYEDDHVLGHALPAAADGGRARNWRGGIGTSKCENHGRTQWKNPAGPLLLDLQFSIPLL